MNLTVRILGKNQIACRGGGIVASRDTLGDGHANCLVGKPKEFGPLAYARTGARRSARLRLHGAIEFVNVEREVIDELTLPHSNFEGCKCKDGMGRGRLPIAEVAARIGDKCPAHRGSFLNVSHIL